MILTGSSGLLMVICTLFLKFDSKQFCSSTNEHNYAAKNDFLVKQQFKHSLHLSDNIFKKKIHGCLNEFWEQKIVTSFAEMYMSSLTWWLKSGEDFTMVTPLTAYPSVKILQRIRLAMLSEIQSRTAAPLRLINRMCITVQCNFI